VWADNSNSATQSVVKASLQLFIHCYKKVSTILLQKTEIHLCVDMATPQVGSGLNRRAYVKVIVNFNVHFRKHQSNIKVAASFEKYLLERQLLSDYKHWKHCTIC